VFRQACDDPVKCRVFLFIAVKIQLVANHSIQPDRELLQKFLSNLRLGNHGFLEPLVFFQLHLVLVDHRLGDFRGVCQLNALFIKACRDARLEIVIQIPPGLVNPSYGLRVLQAEIPDLISRLHFHPLEVFLQVV